jgi:putative protease
MGDVCMKKVELLAPAGSLEKLKMAILYGADAVYIGGEEFGLRASAENFSREDMEEGIKFAHERGKKVYLTMNIIPHNEDLAKMPDFIVEAQNLGVDAVILSDPGTFSIVKETAPDMEIHLSTQANNTNWMSAKFWYEHGVKRIILARELSLSEIGEIRQKLPEDLDLRYCAWCNVHIIFGKVFIEQLYGRQRFQQGYCAHPCRWKYHLVEEKRPGEYMPVFENEREHLYIIQRTCA